MSTLSVPLTPDLEAFIDSQVEKGIAASKAHVVRRALQRLEEEEAVAVVLQAEREICEGKILWGDVRENLKKV